MEVSKNNSLNLRDSVDGWEKKSTIWKEGFFDYELNRIKSYQNPYDCLTDDYDEYFNGWREAMFLHCVETGHMDV